MSIKFIGWGLFWTKFLLYISFIRTILQRVLPQIDSMYWLKFMFLHIDNYCELDQSNLYRGVY